MLLHNHQKISISSSLCLKEIFQARKINGQSLGPILVVCYTNHALDQFLMFLSQYVNEGTEEIIRIGRRSKQPALSQYALHNIKSRYKTLNLIPYEIRKKLKQARDDVRSTMLSLEKTKEYLDELKMNDVIAFNEIRQEMYSSLEWPGSLFDDEIEEFYCLNNRQFRDHYVFEDWLGVGHLASSVDRYAIQNAIDSYRAFENVLNNDSKSVYQAQDFYYENYFDMQSVTEKFENIEIDELTESTVSRAGYPKTTTASVESRDDILTHIVEEAELINNQREIDEDQQQKEVVGRLFSQKDSKKKKSKTSRLTEDNSSGLHGDWNLFRKKLSKNKVRRVISVSDGEMMDDYEVEGVGDLWNLSHRDRMRLYRYLVDKYERKVNNTFESYLNDYEMAVEHFENMRDEESLFIMRSARIIGN
jgi:hypothetical protein